MFRPASPIHRPEPWAAARSLVPAALWLVALLATSLQTGCTAMVSRIENLIGSI